MSDDIHERLARVETTLASVVTTQGHQNVMLEKIDSKLDKQDERLRNIETRSATFATVAAAAVSVGTSLIVAKLTGKA
ncbi:Uncharacterised protein [Starkeya nomas]|uniref:Uncharacterized protein n=1 Tax=Starkeya nomas TaxID=2666134 RepID=A0A5S9NA08_9HYPH|nr:hypothetical protein [Starkeya nomas]CAA0086958.1 Uncharacterised protein [Starkeya nomas]